jgi:hypothetical protein
MHLLPDELADLLEQYGNNAQRAEGNFQPLSTPRMKVHPGRGIGISRKSTGRFPVLLNQVHYFRNSY